MCLPECTYAARCGQNEGCSVDQPLRHSLNSVGLLPAGSFHRTGAAKSPHLVPGRTGQKGELRWTEKPGLDPAIKRKTSQEQRRRPWKDWPVVSYRLADATFTEIVDVCENRQANRGEVVTKLLMHALDAYEAGRLVLESDEPRPVLEEW
jgi:hypothetical protein